MSARAASPFDQLLGLAPARLPKSAATVVVVEGQIVTDVRQITAEDDEDLAATRRRRDELRRAKYQARYQRDRQNPEFLARRKAWYLANRDKVRASAKASAERNHDRLREQQAAWQRRHYYADLEASRQKARDYYAANREKIIAGQKAKRAANKTAKAAKAKP